LILATSSPCILGVSRGAAPLTPNQKFDLQEFYCLDDLLKYHLLQIRSENEIEFCHQLFQEYYAAEWLLQRLLNLTDEQLKYYFLNYLKWTEAIYSRPLFELLLH
jgi:predicted NACHT family NTPase